MLALSYLFNSYILMREAMQAVSMVRMGLQHEIESLSLSNWIADGWNRVDVLVVIFVYTVGLLAFNPSYRMSDWFRAFEALTAALLWIKLLGYLKGLSMKFATYVLCLFQVLRDIRSFLVVLLMVRRLSSCRLSLRR